jgi:3-deoxy-D-manno-octulosonate 8-phosphate phosphatase (KDO 8-P phosphatase)
MTQALTQAMTQPLHGRPISADELQDRAARVTVVAFDVDGVCTDGRLYYGPEGEALHAFQARDGLGIVVARNAGLILAAITGRSSRNVEARLRELRVPHVRQGVARKEEALADVLAEVGATWEQTAYIGDDVNDLGCLKRAGLAACVPEAAEDVLPTVHYVTRRRGGEGALRELLELILRAQGKWIVET